MCSATGSIRVKAIEVSGRVPVFVALRRRLTTLPDVVDWGLCIGCGACAYACKRGAVRMVHVETEGYRPVFDDPRCLTCTECVEICPGAHVNANLEIGDTKQTEADHEFGPVLEIWEGWASDPAVRYKASSGGLLSALSLYCLEVAGFAGVVHAGMDPATPWQNSNHVSRDRQGILARAGSRYAPSAPCAALSGIADADGQYMFVGKPCDAAAVSELRRRDQRIGDKIALVATFFCAGTPSTRGTLDLLSHLGVDLKEIDQVHYRGEGWPGRFRALRNGQPLGSTLSYEESWGRLTGYRPLRCNLCPDGLGRVADIACGDAWEEYDGKGDPGRSLILVRTERGREVLEQARRAGYVSIKRVGSDHVMRAQKNLLARRRTLFGRLLAFRLLGVPTPEYKGFSLFRSWLRLGPIAQAQIVLGTLRRILRRGWYRRRGSADVALAK